MARSDITYVARLARKLDKFSWYDYGSSKKNAEQAKQESLGEAYRNLILKNVKLGIGIILMICMIILAITGFVLGVTLEETIPIIICAFILEIAIVIKYAYSKER